MWRFAGIVLFALALLAGCGGKKNRETELARVGDHRITSEDLDRRLATMPPNVRSQFESKEGRRKLLDGMIDEEAIYIAAKEQKLDENPAVARRIADEVRRVMIKAYYEREIEPYTRMNENDLRSYYDEHLEDLYTRPLQSEVRQVVVDNREDAEQVRKLLLAGADWVKVVDDYCTDEAVRQRMGKIGPVAAGTSLIPFVGPSLEMSATIDSLTIGTISPVIRTPKGFHVFTVTERTPETVIPFEKASETIRRTFQAQFNDKVRKEKVAVLREKYGVRIDEESLAESRGPATKEEIDAAEEAQALFELAQKTTDPQKRVGYYQEIVDRYPEDEHACEAQFMVGFVYSEELNKFDLARRALEEVVKRPNGCSEEMKKSARWMLENMGKEPPSFEDD